MDEIAFNYNPNATIDDGSCIPVMEGCIDGDALNYDSDANTSCNSCCEYSGCTDSTAFNYDSDATQDDGSCIYDSGSLTSALSLKGVMDFTVPSGGSDGKAIHLVATADIADLSVFGLGVANNGGGTDGMEYTLDAVSASSGDDILIVRSVDAMSAYFADCYGEFEIIMVANSDISQNGDDAIELFEQGVVIETFGDLDVDGTGEAWEYMDSWAYKVNGEWTYGAVNCTDGSTTSADSNCPYRNYGYFENDSDTTPEYGLDWYDLFNWQGLEEPYNDSNGNGMWDANEQFDDLDDSGFWNCINCSGEWGYIDWRTANVHVLSHGLHYASCVFEGERAYKGKIFESEQHTKRLFDSAKSLDMEIPYKLSLIHI